MGMITTISRCKNACMTSNGQSITTWREAEHFAAAHMRSLGFADADVTPLGIDGGIDVLAGGAVAQVKYFSAGSIGAPIVQHLKGVAGADRGAVFYALSGYTTAALAFAESAGVASFDINSIVRLSQSALMLPG
jgi:hypothetical protein